MTHNPYTPSVATLNEMPPAAARAARSLATRFSISAALAGAAALFVDDILNPPSSKFPLRTDLIVGLVLGVGTFVWSWVITYFTARLARATIPGSALAVVALGILFSVLGDKLGFLVDRFDVPLLPRLAVYLAWALAFPIVAILALARRRTPPNKSLTREG